MTRVAIAVLVLAGCPPKETAPQEAVPEPTFLDRFAPAPGDVAWTEVVSLDKIALVQLGVAQQWLGPWKEDGRLVYGVVEAEQRDDESVVRARYQVFYGPEGYGYLGTEGSAGFEPWSPPEIVLPADAKIGQKWSATHTKGDRTVKRDCEIMASSQCDDGLVSVCDASSGDTRTVTREHFCPGVGWAGYEALHIAGGRAERRWSEDLRRDGERVKQRAER